MLLVGIRKDKDTEEIIKYELRLKRENVNCLYRDRYGVYVCTHQGVMYKVDYKLIELKEILV